MVRCGCVSFYAHWERNCSRSIPVPLGQRFHQDKLCKVKHMELELVGKGGPCCSRSVTKIWISHCTLHLLFVSKSLLPDREKKPADTMEKFKRRHSKLINSCKYLLPEVLWQTPVLHLPPLH